MEKRRERRVLKPENVIWDLWRNWAVAVGALTLPLILSIFLPKVWVSVFTLIEAWYLISSIKSNRNKLVTSCSLIMRVASRILLVTAIVMLFIVILCTDWLVPTVIHLTVYNQEIPFITALIIFPVAIVFCVAWIYMGLSDSHCRDCQRRYGYYAGDSISATLFYRETRYQMFILLLLSVFLGAVEYWYYFVRYINSDINNPDRFFFNYLPAIAYVLSLLFMLGRYANMKALYDTLEAARPGRRNRTVVRYLIFSGDEILLHQGKDGLFDTSAEAVIDRSESIGDHRARLLFEEMTNLKEFELRYCFTNEGFVNESNIIHYTVFVAENRRDSLGKDDTWFNAYMIDQALAHNALAPVLANEIFRIHTIAMAWKTYDRDGRRLYPIRHYRPTFRFRDLPDWNVDYDDMHWFDIARNNEDKRFYHLRRALAGITDALRAKRAGAR